MELITAIALLCQLNIGFGSGSTSNPKEYYTDLIKQMRSDQKSCQKELAKCINDKSTITRWTVLKCIQERK